MASQEPKHVVSVSLGSSRRDHRVELELLGMPFIIERRGTDGDIQAAMALLRELDGRVDAFGLGGIDLYVVAGQRRYVLRDALRLARAAQRTPVVDGSGLKNTLERRVIRWLASTGTVPLQGKRVLMTAAVDRFGMAEALVEAGAQLAVGDLMFVLGLPVVLGSLRSLDLTARVVAPIVCRLPIHMIYPTGEKQRENTPKFEGHFQAADIVAGDFHMIRRYMPARLDDKIIITNTVTAEDIEELQRRGVSLLVTTTPDMAGRSFGTNVMEAVLVAASGRPPDQLQVADYEDLLDRLEFQPRVMRLNDAAPAH